MWQFSKFAKIGRRNKHDKRICDNSLNGGGVLNIPLVKFFKPSIFKWQRDIVWGIYMYIYLCVNLSILPEEYTCTYIFVCKSLDEGKLVGSSWVEPSLSSSQINMTRWQHCDVISIIQSINLIESYHRYIYIPYIHFVMKISLTNN